MLAGRKTVELRRRALRVPVGTRVWIYETIPGGRVAALAEVSAIDEAAPAEIWRRYRDRAGISEEAFREYFAGTDQGCAVVLRQIQPLREPLPLTDLRRRLGTFVAPQFYRNLQAGGPELSLFRRFSPHLCSGADRPRGSRQRQMD